MALDGPRLLTDRLLLRPTDAADLAPWTAMMQDAEVCRFLGGVQAPSMAWRSLMTMIGAWHAQGFAMFSVIERDSGHWIGRCGPWCPPGWPGTEVGYSFARDAWGRGYATEAATAATEWAIDALGWTDIIQTIDPDNLPSQRVAARLGATLRGPGTLPAPHENAAVQIWGQTRAQWRARRASATA